MFTFAHNWKDSPDPTQNGTPALWLIVSKMSNIEHPPRSRTLHDAVVKTKELTPKQILSVPCNTCGAAIGEVCELHTGAPRTEPHRDRKLSATEAAETKSRKQ
jgi:hypothetical protein